MAIITPVSTNPIPGSSGVSVITWGPVTEADTATPQILGGVAGAVASIQAVGTFGGATVTIQVSNDNNNWAILQDLEGNDAVFTAAGLVDFSTSALYIRPSFSGGTSQSVSVIAVLRQ